MVSISNLRKSYSGIGFKVLLVGVLTLLSLVPLQMVDLLVAERGERRYQVKQDIAQRWGGSQTLGTPLLVIPYTAERKPKTKDQLPIEVTRHLVVAPNTAQIDAALSADKRRRGIYEVPVFQASVATKSTFDVPARDAFPEDAKTVLWRRAIVALGLSDPRGLKTIEMLADGKSVGVEPGLGLTDAPGAGIHAALPLAGGPASITMDVALRVDGTSHFYFVPAAKVTKAKVSSNWANPSFGGHFLPSAHDITEDGFTADWDVPHIATGLPQRWPGIHKAWPQIQHTQSGVALFDPVDIYLKVDRAIKYGLLFTGLTFLTFLLFEAKTRLRMHPVQYLLVGGALILFFLALLSISEHLGFGLAYVLAATIVVGLVCLYVRTILARPHHVVIVGAIMAALYAVLYSLLQAGDFALLNGTIALFFALAVTMYVTRDTNWYPTPPDGTSLEPSDRPAAA
ncbi:MAG: cell envelope integrity protein CreD [Alphaproteobacteria bacterium]